MSKNAQNVVLLDYLVGTVITKSSAYTTLVGDNRTSIEVTGTTTISLGDAATMAATYGYAVTIVNAGTSVVTVTPITGSDKLNGVTGGSVVLPPWTSAKFSTNQAKNGYDISSASSPYMQGTTVASSATINLDTFSGGDYIHVSGTNAISAITLQKGAERTVVFDGALTLTNGASLVLIGGANITTAAGDTAIFRGEASGVVRCISYAIAAVAPFDRRAPGAIGGTTPAAGSFTTLSASTSITPPNGTKASTFTFNSSGGTSGSLTLTMNKVGNFVTLNIPSALATTGTGSTALISNTAIDATYRPSVDQFCACNVIQNNGARLSSAGMVIVRTTGLIEIYRDNAITAYTNGTSCGTTDPTSIFFFAG